MTNNGASFARLMPPQGGTSANLLARSVVRINAPLTAMTLAPSSATAFAKDVVLTVTGSVFGSTSRIIWNGYELPTTFVSSTELRAQLRADDLATAGTAMVSVRTPGIGDSNQLSFTINPGTLEQAEREPNENSNNADLLPLGGARTGVAGVDDRAELTQRIQGLDFKLHDLYAFRLTQPTRVELILQWSDAAADLDLLILRDNSARTSVSVANYPTDQDGAAITAERIVTGTLAPGRYLVAVSAYEGATPYTLSAAISALGILNAASYDDIEIAAPDSILAAFGAKIATSTQSATTLPLPTQLAGTTVRIKDSAGVERPAPLFFVSPLQTNFLIPGETAPGLAEVTITSGDGTVTTARIIVRKTAPGLFTANSNGQGVPAAVIVRVKSDGSQSFETISRLDATANPPRFVATPIDLGPEGETVILVLYGTGIRGHRALDQVRVYFGRDDETGTPAQYAGPAAGFAGLDQINVPIPRRLIGRGNFEMILTIDAENEGAFSNIVMINVK